MKMKASLGDKIFDIFNITLMLIICFVTLYPIWYIIVYSFNDGKDAMLGGIYFWPRKFTLDNYITVFSNSDITTAFMVTIARTVITTTLHVFFTAMVAYAFMKKELIGRKIYMTMGTITLFFGGGLIPYFLLIKSLGLYNNFLVYVIPGMFNFYNLIIFQAFFRELPVELEESAKIDGANDFTIFTRVILPLSTPVLATIALFVGVYNWNDYFMGVIFINNPKLQPIQTFLYKVIAETTSNQMLANAPGGIMTRNVTSQSIKMATMVVTTLPIVCVYPFLQKYFVKGLLIGAIKG
ncbi:binding-protein-dependent transport systems inner membrane component [Caldicellulosiruptor saccharolyticus DSM 8903]|uniref:Binding-protein-dependent transport systems inner membrane component n=1 Tax=Caldicellulosiruptor saccharolyticus (strain ATCC 43494 / DSM 8903 / Tp8T 6331) TaxID=351627 RepID=A4XMJ1_CALS8|nr:carbohydrate ABC transporter permease [Caldicellulosiruptor saccharolyticus]ABP68126.1 binding-protein-dependent transport systems inner membrane component [Caldicellulosiruptor saccharolyticus DSM 8903]